MGRRERDGKEGERWEEGGEMGRRERDGRGGGGGEWEGEKRRKKVEGGTESRNSEWNKFTKQ